MRTTVDLPPELMRRAKAQAAAQGESLKTLLSRAIAAEVGMPNASRAANATRVKLPLFGGSRGPRRHLTNADLAQALADADAEAIARRRRQRR